ncbi:MAG: TatD family hydrolase [Campylobacterales bacterium]
MIIDTHCHLDSSKYRDDLEDVIKRALDSGVRAFVLPGAELEDLETSANLASKYKECFYAAGVHPDAASSFDIAPLREHLKEPKCIAVGECGLDYYRIHASDVEIKAKQKEVFVEQIGLAIEFDKPLIIHIRDATHDSFGLIKEYAPTHKGVLHCYNAAHELLELAHSYYYGIGGVVTFKNARKLIEVFPKIPKDRVVIETDSPYLTPHPHRGTRNEPGYTTLIAQRIAELWDEEYESVCEKTTKNAKELFVELKDIG